MGALLTLPGVIITDTGEATIERARPVLLELVEEGCGRVLAMRTREGANLHDQLHHHRRQIADRLAVIARRAPEVVVHYRQRLRERIDALLAETGSALRDEDLIREVAVYAERSDITEEVTRLQGHLEQFAEIIDANDEDPAAARSTS